MLSEENIVTVYHPQYSTYLNNYFEVKSMQHCTYSYPVEFMLST